MWGILRERGSYTPSIVYICIVQCHRIPCIYNVGFQEASGEASGQESHAAVSNCHAQTRGPGMQTHVEPGVRVPSPHCVSANGVCGGLARQGI